MLIPDKKNSLQNNFDIISKIFDIQIEVMLILLH